MFNPYEVSALEYFKAGFSPLPAVGKLLAVKHVSGRYPLADIEKIEKWTVSHKSLNVALRLPLNVVAIDIDAYKGDLERLAKLEQELGPLPTTWNSDSRGGKGGKLLFRIPKTVQSKRWKSNIGGITIIQHTHRYVMVLPSYNRESSTRYMWYLGLGGPQVPDYRIPSVDDLTELPEAWALALKREDQMIFGSNSEANNVGLDAFNKDTPCMYMTTLTEMCKERVIDAYDTGLHDTGKSVIFTLLTAAINGHAGVAEAMDEVSEAFCLAPNRPRDLGAEWNSLLDWALANVPINETSNLDVCDLTIRNYHEVKVEVNSFMSEIEKFMEMLNDPWNIAEGVKFPEHLLQKKEISQFRALRYLVGRQGRLM